MEAEAVEAGWMERAEAPVTAVMAAREAAATGIPAAAARAMEARVDAREEAAAAADSRQERPVGIPEAAASAAAPRAATAARGKRSRPCICSAGS